MAALQGPVRRLRRRTASRCCASCACTATRPTRSTATQCPRRLSTAPRARTGTARSASARRHGYRNAQATVLAPTGTIGLLMDCDTTGIEPDFALVKFKKLAGGGYFKIVNQSVPRALRRLGYTEREVQEIVAYVSRHEHAARRAARQPPHAQGEGPASTPRLGEGRGARSPACSTSTARSRRGSLGEDTYERLGATQELRSQKGFSLLEHLGFTRTRDRRGERRHRRPHDDRGRAAPARRAPIRSSTARTAAARSASATSRRCRTCA